MTETSPPVDAVVMEPLKAIYEHAYTKGYCAGYLKAEEDRKRRWQMMWQGFSDGMAAPLAVPMYGWKLYISGKWRDLQAQGVWHGWGDAGRRALAENEGEGE